MILVSDTVKNTTYIHDIYHIHMYVYKLYTKSIERENRRYDYTRKQSLSPQVKGSQNLGLILLKTVKTHFQKKNTMARQKIH